MHFPPFWARGESEGFFAWGWSSTSLGEAQSAALEAARKLADRFRTGTLQPRGAYYPDRPFRELVLHEIKSGSGEVIAAITRNSYGCEVLNTANIMFVDIDFPEPESGWLGRLFGRKPAGAGPKEEAAALAKVEAWTALNSEWGWRIYRTRSGLRLLATQAPVAADSEAATRVFEAVGADPLYRRLCGTQKCFRARLTPKPWRCGVWSKPPRWPWQDEKQERRFEKWRKQYESFAANWAACKFLRRIGNPEVHPEAEIVIKLHDGPARAESNLRLA